MQESKLEQWCRDRARERGWMLWKWVSPGRAGVPDRILIHPGGVVFVEFKAPGRQLTKLQAKVKRDLEQLEQHYEVIRYRDEFVALLEALSRGRDPVVVRT